MDEASTVTQLMEFTGLAQDAATRLLETTDYDIFRAIDFHLENAGHTSVGECDNGSSSSTAPVLPQPATAVAAAAEEDTVRAPIPAKREQLVMPEDDNFRIRKRRFYAPTVCPFRNFAVEAEQQEQQLNKYLEGGESGAGATGRSPGGAAISDEKTTAQKRARLADLFVPPVNLLFWGTFSAARNYATHQNRWLIVNLQDNSEFKSQILNRDIWSDKTLGDLVLRQFILWQISVDSLEGFRFKSFYKVESIPYVCIIDPRTGEEKSAFEIVTVHTFIGDLYNYLASNACPLELGSRSSVIRPMPSCTITRPPAAAAAAAATSDADGEANTAESQAAAATSQTTTTTSTAELSEEDQLALAIKNSLKETHEDDVIVLSDSDEECNAYKKYEGHKDDPETTIQLRLPNGTKTVLKWPCSSEIRCVKLFIESRFVLDTNRPYKILATWPQKNLLEMDETMSLVDAQLHPRAILHLHYDD